MNGLGEADRLMANEAIPVLEWLGDRVTLVMARFLLAQFKAELGQRDEAVALAEEALRDGAELRLPVAAHIREWLASF